MWKRSDFKKVNTYDAGAFIAAVAVAAALCFLLVAIAGSCTGFQPVARPTDVELSQPVAP